MSNLDEDPLLEDLGAGAKCEEIEVLDPREVPLGGPRAMTVYRTLPQKGRSLVGPWCFLDHYGPDDVAATGGMMVPRHPHTGLATVSWLFGGSIDHLDSAGNTAEVRPGELNLMLAGRGITHQEISTDSTRVLHGVQLWYALPDATRFDAPGFSHYVPPVVEIPANARAGGAEEATAGAQVRVFLGTVDGIGAGATSPVDSRTKGILGAEVLLEPNASVTLALDPSFEHAVLAEDSDLEIAVNICPPQHIQHRELGYVPVGASTLTVSAGEHGGRALLLGGTPFGEQIVMWWNFVGRTHDEIVAFRERYMAEMGFAGEPARVGSLGASLADSHPAHEPALFGEFPAGTPRPLPAPPMPLGRLRARK